MVKVLLLALKNEVTCGPKHEERFFHQQGNSTVVVIAVTETLIFLPSSLPASQSPLSSAWDGSIPRSPSSDAAPDMTAYYYSSRSPSSNSEGEYSDFEERYERSPFLPPGSQSPGFDEEEDDLQRAISESMADDSDGDLGREHRYELEEDDLEELQRQIAEANAGGGSPAEFAPSAPELPLGAHARSADERRPSFYGHGGRHGVDVDEVRKRRLERFS